MRTSLVLVTLVLAACDDSNGGYDALPDPHVTFLAQGEGATNQLPLEPMRIGARSATGGSILRWQGTVNAGADDLAILEVESLATADGMAMMRRTDVGVVVHALDDALDPSSLPILLVPKTVRVGMIWTSAYGDGKVNYERVVAHVDAVLPIGPASVWGIYEASDDPAGYGKVRWYGEGIGRVGLSSVNSPDAAVFDAAAASTELVVPDADQPEEQLPLRPVALEPVLDPFGQAVDIESGVVSTFSARTRSGETTVFVGDVCITLGASPRARAAGSDPGCPADVFLPTDPNAPNFQTTEVGIDAGEFVPGTDRVMYRSGYGPQLQQMWCDNLGFPNYFDAAARSAWCKFSGVPIAAWSASDGLHCLSDGPVSYVGDELCVGTNPTYPLDDTLTRGLSRQPSNYNLRADQYYAPRFAYPARADASGGETIAMIDHDGSVYRMRSTATGLVGFAQVGVMPGYPSSYVDDDGRAAYSITHDGRVFRTRIDAASGEVVIESLGDVRLDNGAKYHAIAVVPDGAHPGDVIVLILSDGGAFYPTGLYRATLDRTPLRVTSAPALGITAADSNGGIAVCWPVTTTALDASDWTVGGRPVSIAAGPSGPDDSCALIVPDPTPDPAYVGAERAFAGTIPGAGHVRFGYPARSWGTGLHRIAAIQHDGTVFDFDGTALDENGFQIAARTTGLGPIVYMRQDLGGYGMWVEYQSFPFTPWHVGPSGINTDLAVPASCTGSCAMIGLAVGGGMLLSTGDLVRPSGVTQIPSAQLAQLAGENIVLADGRICGFASTTLRCVDASGTITLVTGSATTPLSSASTQPYWPLAGGDILVTQSDPSQPALRFNPTAMTLTVLDTSGLARGVKVPMTAADGRTYGMAEWYAVPTDQVPQVQVVEITAAGLTGIGAITQNSDGAQPLTVIPLANQLMVHLEEFVPVSFADARHWVRMRRP